MPSKLEILRQLALRQKGTYGAQRVERAADEIKNLTKLYSPSALSSAFLGDNAKALMTINPKDFERYAKPLELNGRMGMTTDDYLKALQKVRGGFADVPYLEINKSRPTNLFALPPVEELPTTPFISGHEGRHRNRAMAASGEQAGLVRLEPDPALREGFPRRTQEAYIEALRRELEMTGNMVVPQRDYDAITGTVIRPEIDLPPIYKQGGAVNMAGGGRTGAALSIGQMLKELVSKGNVAPVNRIDMGFKDVSQRVPELTIAANLLKAGKIGADDYAQLVNALKPVTPYAFVPKPATRSEAMNALTENKRQGYGGTSKIEGGERVDARLDIPAYTEHGVWVDSIHRAGFPTSYSSTSSVNNPRIVIPQDKALKVATGETAKSPFAVMRGEWNPLSEKEAVKLAQKSLNNPDWVQVGIDPERHAYGYDRKTMQPVIDGEQMVQVGPLVLVKNPVYGDTSEFKFAGGGEVSQDAMNMAVMNQKVQHKVRGGLNLAEMRKSAQDLWDIAKGTRSKEAQVAAGLYHPIGGGVKMNTPVPLMDFKTIKDPNVKMAPLKIITPEDLYKGRGIPLIGDRALAGRIVTDIGGNKVNVVGEGGPNYIRTHSRKNPAISAAWAAGDEKTTNLAKLAGETGDPVYGINVIGSPTNVDFNTMVTKAILDQYDPSAVTDANKKAFAQVLRTYVPNAKKPHLIPGANFVGMDDVDALREQLMAPGAGNLRKAFTNRLNIAKFRNMGFPDVAHARLATTEPALVDSPIGMAGFTVAKMDTSGNIIEAPVREHTTYPVSAGGSYYGSLDEPVDYQDIFQRFGLYRRGEGANPEADYRSFSLSPQIQDFDQQWLDNIMKTLGRDKPSVSEYKDGGAVNMKGGSLVDELIAESKGKTSSDVKPQMSRQSEFEKDFERYLASQQAAREQVAQDIGIGSVAGGVGFGIQANPAVALADLAGLVLPESFTKNTYYPSSENISEHLNELAKKHLNQYANPIENGLNAGNLAGFPFGIRALYASIPAAKKMGKAVLSAGGKGLANIAGELIGAKAPIKYPSNRPAVSEMYADGGAVHMAGGNLVDKLIADAKGKTSSNVPLQISKQSEFEKDFRNYLANQQGSREQVITEIPQRLIRGAVPGAAGAIAGYAAQVPGFVGDITSIFDESQSIPTTERIQEYYFPRDKTSPEFQAGITGGNAAAIAEGVYAIPAMVRGAARGAKAVGKSLAPKIGDMAENYMIRTGAMLPMVPVAKGGKNIAREKTTFEMQNELAQKRAALPVKKGGLGLPKNNTAEQRAVAMGFTDEGYHGSLSDIKKFHESKASTESHAGRGTYITDSPEDASMNYASIFGPDVKMKVERSMEQLADDRNSIRRIGNRFQDENLTPLQQEVLLANTIGSDNLGVVYPLRYRSDKPINLDFKNPRSSDVGPFEKYNAELDEYSETPAAKNLAEALREYESAGGNSSYIHDVMADSAGEAVPAVNFYKAAQRGSNNMMDEFTGDMISGGVAGSDFVKHLGVDQIEHTPTFRNQQLNLGTQHTVAMDPDNIRSRFAAFDPFRRNAAVAAAMGVAAPDLLAAEDKARGGAITSDDLILEERPL